jgi:hypothetical protein
MKVKFHGFKHFTLVSVYHPGQAIPEFLTWEEYRARYSPSRWRN